MSKLSKDLDQRVREVSKNRCGYCLIPQSLTSHKLEIEHVFPISKGGNSEAENLWLACRHCNFYKSSKIFGFDLITAKRVHLFNPNRQTWSEHFVWDRQKTSVIGKTPCGRATIFALKINDDLQTNARRVWKLTKLFPPKD